MALRAFGHFEFEGRRIVDGASQPGPLEIGDHAGAFLGRFAVAALAESRPGGIASVAIQRISGRSNIRRCRRCG